MINEMLILSLSIYSTQASIEVVIVSKDKNHELKTKLLVTEHKVEVENLTESHIKVFEVVVCSVHLSSVLRIH